MVIGKKKDLLLFAAENDCLCRKSKRIYPQIIRTNIQTLQGYWIQGHYKNFVLNAGEGVEKRESSYTASRNVGWCSHYGEQYRGSSES